jgi:transposase
MLVRGTKDKEHAMAEALKNSIAYVGIDIGKNSFHVVCLDGRGAIVLRQKWSRGQVEVRFANMPPCLIGMEACVGAHHLSRGLQKLGHDARLTPARYVRPYSKGQKNDFRDAEAHRRSGATTDDEIRRDQDRRSAGPSGDAPRARASGQPAHRHHQPDPRPSAGTCVAVRQGLRFLRAELPGILAGPSDALSPRMVRIIEDLAGDWRRLDERIQGLSNEIEAIARLDADCERLISVPGIGPNLQRDGSGYRRWRCVLQGPRLRRLAGPCPQADIDRRPHYPRQDIKAG